MEGFSTTSALSVKLMITALFTTLLLSCADGLTTEAELSAEKGYETGLVYAGDSCAEGCIWSRYAVSLNAQAGEQSCVEGPCACVVEGDVYSACTPTNTSALEELHPTSAPISEEMYSEEMYSPETYSPETYNAGERCAPGCVWSSYAISMGAQAAEASCYTGPCACVQEGDIYASCAQGEAPTPTPPTPPAPMRIPRPLSPTCQVCSTSITNQF